MTVGRGRAGKSALNQAMIHNTFTQAGLPSTIGIDTTICHVHTRPAPDGVMAWLRSLFSSAIWEEVCHPRSLFNVIVDTL